MQTGKTKRKVKRLIAFLLCVIMVLGVGTQEIIGRDVFVVNAEEPEGGSGEAAPEEESSGEEPAEEEPPSGTEPQADEPSGPSEETTPEETAPETPPETPEETIQSTPEETTPEGTTTPETPEETAPEGTTPSGTPGEETTPEGTTPSGAPGEDTTPEGTTPSGTPGETTPEGTTTPETPEETAPDGTTSPETPEETTPEESTEETTPEESAEEETDPVTELVYEGEGFCVVVTALEDVDLSGIELHAAPTETEKAAELIYEAKPGMDVAGILAYEISFIYEETGEAADLSGQAAITIEYTAPELEEGLAEEATLAMFSMTDESVSELTEAEGTVLGDGTAEVLADNCDLYALAWLTHQEQAYDETWEDEDGQVTIHVTADAGVIPEEAELSVTPIVYTEITEELTAEKTEEEIAQIEAVNEQYEFTEQKLTEDLETSTEAAVEADALSADEENAADEAEGKTLEGFLAYDISFLVDGEEVEPNGNVNVTMEFAEAAIPEGVSEDAEVSVKHLKQDDGTEDGIVVEDMAEKATVETTEQAKVQKVELTTDSFSTYIVTWYLKSGQWQTYKVQIEAAYYYKNTDGDWVEFPKDAYKGAKLPENFVSNYTGGDVNLIEYAAETQIGNSLYVFQHAKVREEEYGSEYDADAISINISNSKYYFYYIDRDNGKNWQVLGNALEKNNTKYVYIDFYYEAAPALTTVETIDNATGNITLKMVDLQGDEKDSQRRLRYGDSGNWIDIGGVYGQGNVKQGLVDNTLTNGYPVISGEGNGDKGTSLSTLFGNADVVDNLFIKSIYDNEGYYEYSSFDNYAYLGDSNEFTVYNQLGTPETVNSANNQYYFKRGNFFPYNAIERGKLSGLYNLYDENGRALDPTSSRYNEALYKTQGTTNYYFGMEMEVRFLQPEDGIATHTNKANNQTTSSDMVYEFNGDDDLWVFIDNVLVLDIGGVHDAHSGSINFRKGDVIVHTTSSNVITTNIKQMFQNAHVFPDGKKWDDDQVDSYFDGNTFRDYTNHTLKMFYLERGAGASNLHVKFNLQTVPEGTIEVGKELSNTDKDKYANVEFAFQVWAQKILSQDSEGSEIYSDDEYVLLNTGAYKGDSNTLIEFKDNVEIDGEEYNSVFYLKPGERAQFRDLQKNRKYYVVELGVNAREFDEIEINGTVITSFDADDQETSKIENVESTKEEVYVRPSIVFENSCSAYNRRELQITKLIEGEQEEVGDTFSFMVELEATDTEELIPYDGVYYLTRKDETGKKVYYHYEGNELVPYEVTSDDPDITLSCGTAVEGVISGVPVGYTATITQILSGTKFKVTEIGLNPSGEIIYLNPVYGIASGTVAEPDTQDMAEGIIILGQNAEVTVTNRLKAVPDGSYIEVQKTFEDIDQGKINSNFKISLYSDQDGEKPIKKLILDEAEKSTDGLTYLWKLDDLDEGTYYLKEENASVEDLILTTEVNGSKVNSPNNINQVLTKTFTVDIDSRNEVEFGTTEFNNSTNFIVAKVSGDCYFVWTENSLSAGERSAFVSELNETIEVFSSVGEDGFNIYYFSTTDKLNNGIDFGYGSIAVAGGKLVCSESDKWMNVYSGTYSVTGDAEIEIVNSYMPQSISIDLQKYGSDYIGTQLTGAKFRLYKQSLKDDTTTWTEQGEVEVKTDSTPELTLTPGYYKMEEIQAPDQCMLLGVPIYFQVSASGVTLVDENGNEYATGEEPGMWNIVEGDNVFVLKILNEYIYELPSAGGPGIYLYMLGGALLLMTGALMVYNERKKEVSRS